MKPRPDLFRIKAEISSGEYDDMTTEAALDKLQATVDRIADDLEGEEGIKCPRNHNST